MPKDGRPKSTDMGKKEYYSLEQIILMLIMVAAEKGTDEKYKEMSDAEKMLFAEALYCEMLFRYNLPIQMFSAFAFQQAIK